MLQRLRSFFAGDEGAVTVDWVVLSAAVVGLMAAGYGFLRDGAIDLADGTEEYMQTTDPGQF